MTPETTTPWLRANEAAAYAKVSRATIFKACRDHKLAHSRVGGRGQILTQRPWLDAWLNSLTVHVKVQS